MKVVLDVETTFVKTDKGTDGSAYNHNNHLVTFGYHIIDTNERGYVFLNHKQRKDKNAAEVIQRVLDQATTIIGHNLKFDMSWLYEVGYTTKAKLYDTMIFEYIAAKGRKPLLSLAACAERYGLTLKGEIFKQRMAEGLNTDEMDPAELEEYGCGDIQTTLELYNVQRLRYKDESDIRTMWPAMQLSMEALEVLIAMERAGVAIDTDELDKVEEEFRTRKVFLEQRLAELVTEVMGDTPVNLSSGDDMSAVVYSMRIADKQKWAEEMNIGTELRGSVKKQKYLKRKTDTELRKLMRECFVPVYRTEARQCPTCKGSGITPKYKKDGTPFKKMPKCKTCEGSGVIYASTGRKGGFGVKPLSWEYATASGFSTDKVTVQDLLAVGNLTEQAQLFLSYHMELSAIDVYLTSFVEGIRKSIRGDDFCHPNFNQCITATGRLSSSGPNWQNQPRSGTFPIKRCIVSRWGGGELLEVDFAALEYRAAVALANCPAGIESLRLNKDRHQMTAEVIFKVKKEDVAPDEWKKLRQNAKADTFAPLYGSNNQDPARAAYREAFFAEHTGIAAWHEKLCEEAIVNKQIVIPSGRIFAFPEAARKGADRVVGKTQIVNYPVQSFATADVAWCVIVYLYRLMQEHNTRSYLILQVHDSVTADVHPDEKELVRELFHKAFRACNAILEQRFNFKSPVEFTYEMMAGPNLMEKSEVA